MKTEINVDIRDTNRGNVAAGALLGIGLLFAASAASAGVIFQDDFRSGDLSKKLNGVNFWTNNSSSYVQPSATGPSTITVKPETTPGDYSVRALYAGTPNLAEDARPELRFKLGKQYSELWISFRLYVPKNYFHRVPIGSGNNKFLILYGPSTGDNEVTNSVHYIDFEEWPTADGGGSVEMQWKRMSQQMGWIKAPKTWGIGEPEDRGRWHNYVFHYKMATSARNDGVVQVWKNGNLVHNVTNLDNYNPGYNYFEWGYIFGASNSGFNTDTELRLDDITFSTTPPLGSPRWIP